MDIAVRLPLARQIRQNLFLFCVIASLALHGLCYGVYSWATYQPGEEAVDSETLNIKDVEVDFDEIPPELIGGSSSPAPVERQEWIEGTDRRANAKDAIEEDIDVNQLSGDGTDRDGYQYSFSGDRYPAPILNFDLRKFFPAEAKRAQIREKRVLVRIQVEADGTLRSARIVSPPAGFGFDEAAMKVVNMARFSPGYVRGRPVKMVHDLPIRFYLE